MTHNPQPTLENLGVTTLIRDEDDTDKIIHHKGIPDWVKDHDNIFIFLPGYVSGSNAGLSKNISYGSLSIFRKTKISNSLAKSTKGLSSNLNLGPRTARQLMKLQVIPINKIVTESYTDKVTGEEMAYSELTPCITFNFLDNRRSFNFGQNLDQICFNFVYNQVHRINPQANIICMGLSRGAHVLLNAMANKTTNDYPNLKALVLLEPAKPHAEKILQQTYPGLHLGLKFLFPNHQKSFASIFDAQRFPHIPVFIGQVPRDLVGINCRQLIEKFNALGCNDIVSFISDNNLLHGNLCADSKLMQSLHAFYKKWHLPYFAKLIEVTCNNYASRHKNICQRNDFVSNTF
jgi:hypothetical protein